MEKNQRIRFVVEKDVKSFGKIKTKQLQEGVIGAPEMSQDDFLQTAYLINEFVNHREAVNMSALEEMVGSLGYVVVEDSSYKYIKMPLAIQDVMNFGEYKDFLSGVIQKPKIREISLPEDTKVIPDKAFADLKGLVVIRMNEGLEIVGDGAFSGCSSLGEEEEIVFPDSIKVIGGKAFAGTTSLQQDVILGRNLETLGESAFAGSGIYGVNTENCVKLETIPKTCFKNAELLSEVVLGCNVYEIDDSAFEGCEILEEINLENVSSLGYCVFKTKGISNVREFNLSSLEYACPHAISNARNSTFILPEGFDEKMAKDAGIPYVIVKKVASEQNKPTSTGLREKSERRDAVKNVVNEVSETEDVVMIGRPKKSVEGGYDFSEVEVVDEETRKTQKPEKKKEEKLRIKGPGFGGN